MNGKRLLNDAMPHIWDALKMVIVTALVGGLLVWKNAAILETKFDHLCGRVDKMEIAMGKLTDKLINHLITGK